MSRRQSEQKLRRLCLRSLERKPKSSDTSIKLPKVSSATSVKAFNGLRRGKNSYGTELRTLTYSPSNICTISHHPPYTGKLRKSFPLSVQNLPVAAPLIPRNKSSAAVSPRNKSSATVVPRQNSQVVPSPGTGPFITEETWSETRDKHTKIQTYNSLYNVTTQTNARYDHSPSLRCLSNQIHLRDTSAVQANLNYHPFVATPLPEPQNPPNSPVPCKTIIIDVDMRDLVTSPVVSSPSDSADFDPYANTNTKQEHPLLSRKKQSNTLITVIGSVPYRSFGTRTLVTQLPTAFASPSVPANTSLVKSSNRNNIHTNWNSQTVLADHRNLYSSSDRRIHPLIKKNKPNHLGKTNTKI